jgi:hypothetical protein
VLEFYQSRKNIDVAPKRQPVRAAS